MFSQDRGATASYRMLARGFGRSWTQTYKAAQQQCGVRQLQQAPTAGAVVPGQRGAGAASSGHGRA